jgi:hypothetical protein
MKDNGSDFYFVAFIVRATLASHLARGWLNKIVGLIGFYSWRKMWPVSLNWIVSRNLFWLAGWPYIITIVVGLSADCFTLSKVFSIIFVIESWRASSLIVLIRVVLGGRASRLWNLCDLVVLWLTLTIITLTVEDGRWVELLRLCVCSLSTIQALFCTKVFEDFYLLSNLFDNLKVFS